jgi:uncharacterized protein with FMN-binding domain
VAEPGSNKKVANSLVALSSAAVLAVYSAGYQRTQAAADRFERLAANRRHAGPAPAAAGTVTAAPATPLPSLGTGSAQAEQAAQDTPTAALDAGRAASGPAASPGAPADAGAVSPPEIPGVSAGATAVPAAAASTNASPVPAPSAAPPAADLPQAENAPSEIAPITPPPRGRFRDGTYQGRGSCIHGDIQAQVVVKNGRITEATISSCETRYSCDWLDPILPQVAARQSAFVDYVSGATDSTDAFSAAVTDALLKAQ